MFLVGPPKINYLFGITQADVCIKLLYVSYLSTLIKCLVSALDSLENVIES